MEQTTPSNDRPAAPGQAFVLTCMTTTGTLSWRNDGLIVSFGTTSVAGSILHIGQITYELLDVSEEGFTSTATIQMVTTSDNGTRISCGNGQMDLSRDIIVVNMSGGFARSFGT